jgi:hypothetical protein
MTWTLVIRDGGEEIFRRDCPSCDRAKSLTRSFWRGWRARGLGDPVACIFDPTGRLHLVCAFADVQVTTRGFRIVWRNPAS